MNGRKEDHLAGSPPALPPVGDTGTSSAVKQDAAPSKKTIAVAPDEQTSGDGGRNAVRCDEFKGCTFFPALMFMNINVHERLVRGGFPGGIGIIFVDFLGDLRRGWPQILLKNPPLLIDDEGHDA